MMDRDAALNLGLALIEKKISYFSLGYKGLEDDMRSDAALKLFRFLDKIVESDHPEQYMITTIRNECFQTIKKAKAQKRKSVSLDLFHQDSLAFAADDIPAWLNAHFKDVLDTARAKRGLTTCNVEECGKVCQLCYAPMLLDAEQSSDTDVMRKVCRDCRREYQADRRRKKGVRRINFALTREDERRCNECEQWKNISQYNKCGNPSGPRGQCKGCQRKADNARYHRRKKGLATHVV